MIEWVLVVWLVVGESLAPAFEVGTFRVQAACEASASSIRWDEPEIQFIAMCIERDK